MNHFYNKWPIVMMLALAPLIGLLKGNEAKQKWVFKFRNRHEEKKQIAEEKKMVRNGGVALDDIELASYHKS
jgi:hypothetical protein